MLRTSLALSLILVSCSLDARSAAKKGLEPASLNCPIPRGWKAVEQQKSRFVVFGELHGTEQAPQFVGNLACSQAIRGKRVLVAIEHSATDNAALQQAWLLPSGQFEPALAKLGWAGRTDGVASKAMFDMVVRLHVLKERGTAVRIAAFNGAKDKEQHGKFSHLPGQGPHEAAQAENIATAAGAGNYDLVLVLVGNLHAKKAPVTLGGTTFDPMALRLSAYGKVSSLVMRHDAGSSWNCRLEADAKPRKDGSRGPSDIHCGSSPTKGYPGFQGQPYIALHKGKPGNKPGEYDGIFWVGPVTASPPAFP